MAALCGAGRILAQAQRDVKQMRPGAYNSMTVSAAHIAVIMSVIPPTTPQRI